MNRFFLLVGLVAVFLATSAMASDDPDSCRSEGAAVGREAGTAFCRALEREYASETIVFPFGTGFAARVCEARAQMACKREMARTVREFFPLCAQLIRTNWTNSRGEGARRRWIQYQQSSCLIELPDND